ncbi:unnamed protein product [Callosobruchus maculatus]|uniref:Uncharacterized protein n=1 Tax=Callosobruchus maculatus TaxID=64391 RepID=A0A653DWJ3_CALMS|nr:unnamed protein product [Callosobruchus maculatus]
MAFCKITLFLASVAIAIASVSSIKCYTCNSGFNSDDKECEQPRNDNSTVFECGEAIISTSCLRIHFERDGVEGVARTCSDASAACFNMMIELWDQGIHIKDCFTCLNDLCNSE